MSDLVSEGSGFDSLGHGDPVGPSGVGVSEDRVMEIVSSSLKDFSAQLASSMSVSFDQMRELIDSRMPVHNPSVSAIPSPVQIQPVPSQNQQDASRPRPPYEISDLGVEPDESVQVESDKVPPHILEFFKKARVAGLEIPRIFSDELARCSAGEGGSQDSQPTAPETLPL